MSLIAQVLDTTERKKPQCCSTVSCAFNLRCSKIQKAVLPPANWYLPLVNTWYLLLKASHTSIFLLIKTKCIEPETYFKFLRNQGEDTGLCLSISDGLPHCPLCLNGIASSFPLKYTHTTNSALIICGYQQEPIAHLMQQLWSKNHYPKKQETTHCPFLQENSTHFHRTQSCHLLKLPLTYVKRGYYRWNNVIHLCQTLCFPFNWLSFLSPRSWKG